MPATVLLPEQRPDYVPGNWYQPIQGLVTSGAALPANNIRMMPFLLHKPMTLAALGVRVVTVSAGGNAAVAIYASNETTLMPEGAPLAALGGLSTASAAVVSGNLGSSVALSQGLYWMSINSDNAVASFQTVNGALAQASFLVGSTTLANISPAAGGANFILTLAQTYGTWPNMTGQAFVESANTTANAVVYLKAA